MRQEAENAVLKLSVHCEEEQKMRSECEHVLRLGAEQDERIALLQAEIARMQKERMESTADDAKDFAGNLRKETLIALRELMGSPWSSVKKVRTLKTALTSRPPRGLVRRLGEELIEWQ